MLFEDVFEEYKIYASKRHKKQCFDTITQIFKKYILSYFKGREVSSLTIQDIISWEDYIYSKNFSNNYNKNIYCSFNSFMKYCVLCSYISSNLLSVVGCFKKKFEIHDYDVYNLYEFKRFRHGLKNRVYRYFFDFLYSYGTRSGEAMALKFSDLRGKHLHIGSSIQRRGKRAIDTPKTPNFNRFLTLDIVMRLKMFILKCYYIKKYGDSNYDYFIFGGKSPLSPTSIKRYKHSACAKTGIREITVHEFRHSYATRMIKKGVPVEKVSRLLGHSSVSITLDVYVHHEKREASSLSSKFDFLNTITQSFKKILQFIITRYIV